MEIVNLFLSPIVEDLVKSTCRQVGYIFRFKSIIEDLNEEAENLRLAHENMQHRVDGAIKDTDEIEKDVEKWLRDVTAVVADAEDLEKQTREKKTCLNGLCPNWICRYQMAKRAQKKTSIMVKLKDGGKFDNISHPTTLPGINVLTPKDFMLFESTTYTFNLIIEALKDDNNNVVGLYGMGGVGKTTMAKAVVNKAKEEKIFNEVMMVVVSQTPNVRDIQDQLADLLNFKLEEKSREGRAERLYMRLKNEKKILIILDDIWEKIDLAVIGIPVDDHHKDCKIFLTTRQKQVCIDMGCQSRIPLNVLTEEEGLVLFKRHAGLHDVHSPTTIKLAKEVVKECKGLPLAIVTIGSALKEKAIDEWKIVTQKLKKSKLMDADIVDAKLYACLKLSYDYLKNDKTKFCFLICSLFPEDHEIDLEELVRYGLGLGLYQDIDSIEEARSELRVTVNNLKASSLLLDAKEGHVKMHDVVRDVALWITSKGEEVFMVKAGMGLTEWPKYEGLEQCTAISLMGNRIEVLPDGLVCPKLKILLLDSYLSRESEVSDEFFEKMKDLKVLSLGGWNLSLNSLQFLTNLVTLQLLYCKLRDISSLKKLSKLEILNLKGSMFVEFPEELEELSKLRMLNIRDCGELKRIPANVIPRLSRLEELYIGSSSFKAWEVEGTSAERSNAILSELYQLNHLTILSLNINVQPCLSKDFVLPTKLLRYEIKVNYDSYDWPYDWPSDLYPISRLLKIRDIGATSLVAFKALYKNVEYLKLMEIKGCCQNMVPSIDETGLNELKILSLERFTELECIIDTQQVSLQSLTVVQVKCCNKLRYLFTLSLARSLLQLEELQVWACDSLEHIVEIKEAEENVGGGGGNDVMFPKLRKLELYGLENFINFFDSENSSLNMKTAKEHSRDFNLLRHGLQNLEELNIEECGGVQVLFQLEGLEQELAFPSLKELCLFHLEELECLCKGPTQLLSLPNLKRLTVRDCNRLRHMFSPSLARNLLQLEKLIIDGCGKLEYIVSIKAEANVGGGGGNDVMLPKLRILVLHGLPNFIDFCSENSSLNVQTTKRQLRGLRHGLPNLEELYIIQCGVQVLFHLEGLEQALAFPSLEVLYLSFLEELECLCKGPTHLLSLPNLKKLEVNDYNRLRHMFSPSLARNLLQLEELSIGYCGELEQIFIEDDAAEYNQTLSKDHLQWPLLFPNLSRIDIWSCYKLKSMFPVNIAHLLSLQNLTTLKLSNCHGLTHIFSSTTLVRNLLRLESIYITDCGELEQIIVEDHTEDDHVQLGLFPNLSSISIEGCSKLKTIFPDVTIARSGLQKLKTLKVENSFQLEELFGHKDEADMTSHREMVLPQLQELSLGELASLVYFCPVGYHFIFPSLSNLVVTECPKLTTRFSVDQNRSVHTEAKAPQTGKEDVDMEQSPPETIVDIKCLDFDDLQKQLPQYIGK